ncbi:hypothetical protein [Frankia sp. R82]|uniref:hypothetical protein n=1 Tax=Frankia sp. R82 TaxID=2950553 RepID=UPI002044009A|nr:hypothetical protein [Frankia sp. R82]MCM3883152.1 hypothetical protein [Frankia sp. R82]
MVYLSRRRRRRGHFWGFVLLVWLLGVAAANDVPTLVAYIVLTVLNVVSAAVAITVLADLAAGRRRQDRRRVPPR